MGLATLYVYGSDFHGNLQNLQIATVAYEEDVTPAFIELLSKHLPEKIRGLWDVCYEISWPGGILNLVEVPNPPLIREWIDTLQDLWLRDHDIGLEPKILEALDRLKVEAPDDISLRQRVERIHVAILNEKNRSSVKAIDPYSLDEDGFWGPPQNRGW